MQKPRTAGKRRSRGARYRPRKQDEEIALRLSAGEGATTASAMDAIGALRCPDTPGLARPFVILAPR
ncbi:MAG: hypothetical protein U0414_23555 [Polyangiaceae bacterium]